MREFLLAIVFASSAAAAAAGEPLDLLPGPVSPGGGELPAYLQCVPFARDMTGIRLFGDAWTWWGQAEGRYARGHIPQVGAVMAFRPYAAMRLGHVAAVTGVVDSRTVLLTHANWSPIEGRRGQVERNVRAVDVSPDNDWSQVRVWYDPIGGLGTTAWPVQGFIYPQAGSAAASAPAAPVAPTTVASARPAPRPHRDVIGDIIRANS